MKKASLTFLVGGVLLLFLSIGTESVFAQSGSGERIVNFDSIVEIHSDASLSVTEHIVYDFGDSAKHGIYRDIPIKRVPGNARPIRVSDISVTDVDGAQYMSDISGTNTIHIKIGDPDQLVTGEKTYVIRYTVQNAVGYFPEYDEIYWNATGNDWQVPIDAASASVALPKTVDGAKLKIRCYSGAAGSTASCDWNHPATFQNSAEKNGVSGSTTSVAFGQSGLNTGDGLTVAVGFPKGIVEAPRPLSFIEKVQDFLSTFGFLLLPLAALLVMGILWYKKGRDPHGKVSIIAEYESPDNLTPLEIGEILRERMSNADMSAEIIYLATKGYLKIAEIEVSGLIFKHGDYLLTKLKEPTDLQVFDQKLMDALFETNEVKLSDLKEKFYKSRQGIQKELGKNLVAKGYFTEDPISVRVKYAGIGIAIVFGAFLVTNWFAVGGMTLFGLLLAGAIVLVFSFIMPRRTQKGFDARNKIKGLKDYLNVAEKDRINFANAPEKRPELFEKLLPFAMVLGVEKAWAKQFESIYLTPPSWYSGSYGGGFNTALFASNLSSFSSASAASFSPAGSGSGGGGFSGGGGGGGGGGSW